MKITKTKRNKEAKYITIMRLAEAWQPGSVRSSKRASGGSRKKEEKNMLACSVHINEFFNDGVLSEVSILVVSVAVAFACSDCFDWATVLGRWQGQSFQRPRSIICNRRYLWCGWQGIPQDGRISCGWLKGLSSAAGA